MIDDARRVDLLVLQWDRACLREGVARRPWMAGGMGTDGDGPVFDCAQIAHTSPANPRFRAHQTQNANLPNPLCRRACHVGK